VLAGTAEADAALSSHLDRTVHLSRDVPAEAKLHRQLPDEAGMVPDWMDGALWPSIIEFTYPEWAALPASGLTPRSYSQAGFESDSAFADDPHLCPTNVVSSGNLGPSSGSLGPPPMRRDGQAVVRPLP
jgi:hypothetical protein